MTIEASSKESPIMKFGGIASSGMEPGICRLWGHSQGHGHAIMAWKIVMIMPRDRRPGHDLDDVNAAF